MTVLRRCAPDCGPQHFLMSRHGAADSPVLGDPVLDEFNAEIGGVSQLGTCQAIRTRGTLNGDT